MPYQSISELPDRVKGNIPSDEGKTLFMEAFNSADDAGRSEIVSFSAAWAALSRAGYEKGEDGMWRKGDEVEKAEYQGREVELNKPFRLPEGASKKFGVYVSDGDDVKRVTFGSPDMEIKRDDPEARASFRARFKCDEVTDKTSATYWSCKMWEPGTTVSEQLDKRYMNDDAFTLPQEAAARSHAIGFGGEIHAHETADGQRVYMPGSSHEVYMQQFEDDHDDSPSLMERLTNALERLVGKRNAEFAPAPEEDDVTFDAEVLKMDDEQRIVWGWLSVITEDGVPVVDLQGDVISPEELTKAADDFMLSTREAKAMHKGERVGEFFHSLPLTYELAKAFGIETRREGWIVAMKVHDDETWKRVKSGELSAFSIGGKAIREPFDDDMAE